MTTPLTTVTAEASILSYLMYRGRFEVPWHQRYYDWTQDEVHELLDDIDEAIRAERKCYFLGAMMLVEKSGGIWEINDGQQRMVTFSLICARLARMFAYGVDPRREALALRVLFRLYENHTQTLSAADSLTPRLSPPRNDRTRYNALIRGDEIGTNGKLTTAWEVIDRHFTGMGLERAQRFLDFAMNNLEVACLFVPRSINPNAVFETLNARGKPLDDLDLIRNHLYSFFDEDEGQSRRETVHENLENIRHHLGFGKKTSDYVRCCFQCRYGFLPSTRFYRETKRKISEEYSGLPSGGTADFVYDLVGDLSRAERVELFRLIASPSEDDEMVGRFLIDSRTSLNPRNLYVFLCELKNYKVAQPMVFALLDYYVRAGRTDKRAVAIVVHRKLKLIASFVMRTALVAGKFEPSHFEKTFSDLARDLMSSDNLQSIPISDVLQDSDEFGIYDDSTFIRRLSEVSIRDNAKAKRFLMGLAHSQNPESIVINERKYTVEHVLPSSPTHLGGWHNFDVDSQRAHADRIGNLALLSEADNKPGNAFNRNFERKKEIFANSFIGLTKEIAQATEWSPQYIQDRQTELAELACQVWNFPDEQR